MRVFINGFGRIGRSVLRASVAAVDLAEMTQRAAAAAAAAVFRATAGTAGAVIGATDQALVSSDLRARAEPVAMACPETRVTAGGMLRVFGWYDNEWGFSNRMLDVALRMAPQRH